MPTIRVPNPARRALRTGCLLALVCVLATLVACSRDGQGGQTGNTTTQAIPVEVASAAQQSITANYSGTATLDAVADAQVVAKATGIVLQLLAEEGMRVRKGQLLAVLDDAAARNKLAQANGTLRKAQAAFEKAQKGFALQVTSRSEYDSDKYDLETQRAVVAGAEIDLANTRVAAPIAGVVAKRSIKLGNLVQANQTLFEIVDMDPLQAVLNVPERDLDTLKAGQPVRLRVDALPGRVFAGTIARIAPVVDAASGTFRATCQFRDDTRALKPGMFGRVEVAYDQRHDALVVPRAAIVEEDGESSVFVIEPAPAKPAGPAAAKGRPGEAVAAERAKPIPSGLVAKRRLVKTGYTEGDRVEIRDGLNKGDRVITIGRNAVRDGTEVQVIGATQAAVAAVGPGTKR
jgi:membrane fusion protein (multidrug efflux system)